MSSWGRRPGNWFFAGVFAGALAMSIDLLGDWGLILVAIGGGWTLNELERKELERED